MSATYEVRFQNVAPERRAEYVRMYKKAIQEIKQAGCKADRFFAARKIRKACSWCWNGKVRSIINAGAARRRIRAFAARSKAGRRSQAAVATIARKVFSCCSFSNATDLGVRFVARY